MCVFVPFIVNDLYPLGIRPGNGLLTMLFGASKSLSTAGLFANG